LFLLDVLLPEGSGSFDPAQVAGPVDIGFSDIHAAVRARRGLHTLYASVYQGENSFGNDVFEERKETLPTIDDEYIWTNRTGQMRYEWVQGSRAFGHAGIWASEYRLDHPFDDSPFGGLYPRRPDEGTDPEGRIARSDFALSLDPLGRVPLATPGLLDPIRWRLHATAEDVYSPSQLTTLTLGTRFSYLPAQRRLFVEPRLALRHDQPDGRWAFRGAAGLYRQFIYQFDERTSKIVSE
jgi:hypothetical protein